MSQLCDINHIGYRGENKNRETIMVSRFLFLTDYLLLQVSNHFLDGLHLELEFALVLFQLCIVLL
jgi:hypothetical protein